MNTPFIIVDLDGTLLHDAPVFEQRSLSQRTIDTIDQLHARNIKVAVATARPVSTALDIVQQLRADACIYLNGALTDYNPSVSDFASLTGKRVEPESSIEKIGFSSDRASEICRDLQSQFPELEIGIVMDDVRYTNFDVRKYWKTQEFTYSNFNDLPQGITDKIIIFPSSDTDTQALAQALPDDLVLHISEGVLWMLMAPLANKEHAARLLCEQWNTTLSSAITFGDDLIDMPLMQASGTGVAVANAHPKILAIADAITSRNNDDGVAAWIEEHLL